VAGCALAGCGGGGGGGGDNGYPKVAETNFVKACTAQPGASQTKCQCAYDKIKARIPFDEFKKADTAIQSGKQPDPATQQKIVAAVKDCK
jgi:hypothetical protein